MTKLFLRFLFQASDYSCCPSFISVSALVSYPKSSSFQVALPLFYPIPWNWGSAVPLRCQMSNSHNLCLLPTDVYPLMPTTHSLDLWFHGPSCPQFIPYGKLYSLNPVMEGARIQGLSLIGKEELIGLRESPRQGPRAHKEQSVLAASKKKKKASEE